MKNFYLLVQTFRNGEVCTILRTNRSRARLPWRGSLAREREPDKTVQVDQYEKTALAYNVNATLIARTLRLRIAGVANVCQKLQKENSKTYSYIGGTHSSLRTIFITCMNMFCTASVQNIFIYEK